MHSPKPHLEYRDPGVNLTGPSKVISIQVTCTFCHSAAEQRKGLSGRHLEQQSVSSRDIQPQALGGLGFFVVFLFLSWRDKNTTSYYHKMHHASSEVSLFGLKPSLIICLVPV